MFLLRCNGKNNTLFFEVGSELVDSSLALEIEYVETNINLNTCPNDEFYLSATYQKVMQTKPFGNAGDVMILISADVKGLRYLIDKINDYLASGDYIQNNLNFDIGSDLSYDSLFMDIICDEDTAL